MDLAEGDVRGVDRIDQDWRGCPRRLPANIEPRAQRAHRRPRNWRGTDAGRCAEQRAAFSEP